MKHRWLAACLLLFAAAAGAAQTEWTRAKVIKVEAGRSRVVLDHAPIRSIGMEAMVMPFKADPNIDLKRFKPGDRVRFSVATRDDHLVIEAMEKLK
jgi:Cu/Ag efflux protein CusF